MKSSIQYYNLGVLAEEGTQDTSRHQKHAFWTIDPLDGTQFYVEGKEGFAVSIALVSKTGEPILGVVYNPVNDTLYHAFKGQGLYINDLPHSSKNNNITQQKMTLYADKSIERHPLFEHFQSSFDIQYSGGAVMNSIHVLTTSNACYFKLPKDSIGGGAIWDFAAVTVMLQEAKGNISFFDGTAFQLNRDQSVYFNDVGLMMTSHDVEYEQVIELIHTHRH